MNNTSQAVTTREHADKPEEVQHVQQIIPLVDVYENADELLLLADMPGVQPDDLKIRLEKNELTIEGCVDGFQKDEAPWMYKRAFTIPQGIDGDKVAANLRDGVLTLHLPRHDSLRPREIAVQAG